MLPLRNLRAVRERQALSQAELAALVAMHQPALSQLERCARSPQPRTLRKLARALKVKPADLIGDREPAAQDRPSEWSKSPRTARNSRGATDQEGPDLQ